MSVRFFQALLAQQTEGSAGAGAPLDYGGDLKLFLDAESGVTADGSNDVSEWVDQDASTAFTLQVNTSPPLLRASVQNSLPGIDFTEVPATNGSLNRKLSANASVVDSFFDSGNTNQKSIAFAARLDKATDSRFNTNNTLASKGFRVSGGWQLFIDSAGTMTFQQRRSDNSIWSMAVPAFYSPGDLVLGYMNYNGGNASGSGFFRLYNGSEFVTVGNVTVGTSSIIGNDDADQMVIGNIRDPANIDANAPFNGPIFGLWMTEPAANFFDETYLARWIP